MLQNPKVVFQAPELGQSEMNDNYSSEENHISLDQASQKPAKKI